MAQVIVTESSLENIAGAIRSKLGTQATYKPAQMAGAIAQIHGNPVLEELNTNANGTFTPSSGKDGFSRAIVNVANSYSASDEGKVVSNGALVAQSIQTITDNGTYDTTLKNQVTVNVSGGGGGETLFYDIGEYFGNDEGTTTTSQIIKTSGHIGNKAILVVMHRDTITLDSSWTLIYKYANPSSSTYTITQFISVYEKIITSSEESYNIQQNSSARMCACLFYISSDATLRYDSAISMDDTKSNYTFYIPKKTKYTLCVMSCCFSANTTTSINPNIAVNSKDPIDATTTRRMLAFINTSLSTVALETQANADAASLFYNRMILFEISI